jgi:hypothetical protein
MLPIEEMSRRTIESLVISSEKTATPSPRIKAIVSAPYREALGLRETSTADLAGVKKLLLELWQTSKIFDRPRLTVGDAREAGTHVQCCLRGMAKLLLGRGEEELEIDPPKQTRY